MKTSKVLALSTLSLFFLLTPGAAMAGMDDYPFVKLKALDKSTARTETFDAEVGSTIQYGPLFIKIQSCRKSQPIDKPESVSFLQIWEIPAGEPQSKWVFSGWMYASSPALSGMDHPVYDVWVLDCLSEKGQAAPTPEPEPAPVQESPKPEPVAAEDPAPEQPVPAETPAPVVDTPAPTPTPAPEPAASVPTPDTLAPSAAASEPEQPKKPAKAKKKKQAEVDYGLGSWGPPQ